MIKKHFPKDHKLHKIFNTNTIKLSYSCMPNMSSVIKQHNQKVLSSSQTNKIGQCNWKNPASCPLNGKSLTKNIFIKQLYQQSPILIHITAVVKISSFATTTIKNHFATNIVKTIQNFLNIYGTLKMKMWSLYHREVCHSTCQPKKSFEQKDKNHLEMAS